MLKPWHLMALRLVAALACFIIAMMAAGDARTAREHGRPIAFATFMLLTIVFSMALGWVLLS